MKARWWIALGVLLCLHTWTKAGEAKKPETKSYQVPYLLTDTKHVMVRAKINGKGPFNFILDTGAPAVFVATGVCKKIGIEPDKKGWGVLDRFDLEGGVTAAKTKVRVEDPYQLEGMNALGLAGVRLDGIIGYNFLARYRLELDFTKDKMEWTDLKFDPPPPEALPGQGGAPGGLDSMASLLKLVGGLLGKKGPPRIVGRGFLGVELADGDGSVQVNGVLAKSPAATAGFQAGDRITHYQGKEVKSQADIIKLAAKLSPGDSVRITIIRDAGKKEITFKAGEGL